MWKKKKAAEKRKKDREKNIRSKNEKKKLAVTKTEEAQAAIQKIKNTLLHTLSTDDAIDWESLLDQSPFPEKKPSPPKYEKMSTEPKASDEKYRPDLGFIDRVFSRSRNKKIASSFAAFESDHIEWVKNKKILDNNNNKLKESYQKKIEEFKSKEEIFLNIQEDKNKNILNNKQKYQEKNPGAVLDYCELVLSNSEYPDNFPQNWDVEYWEEGKIFIVDYSLPNKDHLPTTKTFKYTISRDEFSESKLSKLETNRLYDSLLYQISLRTIHELFEADVVDAIGSIVFNGWVESIDKATGLNVNACILSVQASKEEFLAINLENVDPKACFKQLKGVGSSKLHGLSPVAPIIKIDREDTRFVSPYDVVDSVNESVNLAAMNWQDFENLIREMFEKEFISSGGDVKITQASRDGGVDAVAFDPDPIRGGKIVIQAKRYTNVVGVSAVRDLFGTTVNEGATKGILVTTSDYGPDAYEFAKGKPLTLLNGGNLLHLLEKHGHKAKIDLIEAKKILAEE